MIAGCHNTEPAPREASPETGGDSGPESCGTSGARSKCESVVWPRLVLSFGDEGARALVYSVTTDDGMQFDGPSPCPAGYGESEAFRCDIGYFGNAEQKVFTLRVAKDATSAAIIVKEIELTEFNYCGRGVAHVIVTTNEAAMPSVSDVRYISVCESL